MKIPILRFSFIVLCALSTAKVSALTAGQFVNICEANEVACHDIPLVQAYIGGALDLLATLDEQTEYLNNMYCDEPKTLFDIPAIVNYIKAHHSTYASRNAMVLLVRYIEEHGACNNEQ